MKTITRQKLNIVIDMAMLVLMVALAVIGFLIRYVLLSGTMRWEKFGRNVDMTFLGLDRHQWGYIHLIIGILLVVLLVLHIVFHWTQIVCMVKRLLPVMPVRAIVITSLALVCAAIIFIPLIIRPEIGSPIRGQGQSQELGQEQVRGERRNQMFSPTPKEESLNTFEDIETPSVRETEKEKVKPDPNRIRKFENKKELSLGIQGYHTIGILASAHSVNANELKQRLNIPASASNNERLGRLRKLYGFTMREVEDCILELQSTR